MSVNRKLEGILVVIGLSALSAWASAQQPPARTAPPAMPPAPPAVATVGPMRVARMELDATMRGAAEDYRRRTGNDLPTEFRPMIERQMLENLIRSRLLMLEAERRGLRGTVAEAEAQMRQDPFFQENGRFSETKFQTVKAQDPVRWNAFVEQVRTQSGALKLSERLERQHAPDEAAMRVRAERELQRVSLDYLPLRYVEFPGGYDEPREQELLDLYRAQPDLSRRPERVRLTLVFVDRPALPESLAGDEAQVRAWEARLRPRADSVVAALRAGASIDSLGARLGGVRRDVIVTRESFPGFWAGDERVNAAVLATPVGEVVSEPVRARPGWLAVRVEERTPERIAPLREVARDLRSRLRRDAREFGEERRLRAFYHAHLDSLSGPGVKVRYAVFDTGAVAVPAPKPADLDRFFRGHLADYSSFDPVKGAVVVRPLAEVRDEIARRWAREKRLEMSRAAAERTLRAWAAGKRDGGAERTATTLREVGPVRVPGVPDTGAAALVLADSLARQGAVKGAGYGNTARGPLVWVVTDVIPRVVPTFESMRPRLAARLARIREDEEEAGARAMWEVDRSRFSTGNVVQVMRLVVPRPEIADVPLTREEVERWHQEHLSDYAAGEEVKARHILFSPVSPDSAAVEAARLRAVEVLRRLRAGERFADLARQYSDDVATKDAGGDLGMFGRGVMLDAFDRAVFAMKPGEISDPVRTEVGWHLIECLEHLPASAEPLAHVYINVGSDAALAKAERISLARADSLLATIRTVEQAKAVARRTGLPLMPMRLTVGEPVLVPSEVAYVRAIERMKPGELYPAVHPLKGFGHTISWIDTILPPQEQSWDQARTRALLEYRGDGARRTMTAKKAELDSLLAGGWSFDSLGTLFGGLEHAPDYARLGTLRILGRAPAALDSLVFGTATTAPPVSPGGLTPWLSFPSGDALVRLADRVAPLPAQVNARVESDRRAATDNALRTYFEGLKQRFPVRILDARLRDQSLPMPPPGTR